jgi:hypothetical protein
VEINLQESKRDRFTRVAERRTNAVLEKIRVLGNCANRSIYDYTEEDVTKVFGAIKKALREAESLYRQKSSKRFRLKE